MQSRKNYVSDNISFVFVLKICAVGNKIKRIFFTVQFNIVARSHNERSYYIAAYRRYTAKSLAARAAYNVQKYGFGTVVKVMCRCDFCVFACRIFKALIPFSPAALLFALARLFTLKRYVKAEYGQFYSQVFAKIGTKFFISQSLFAAYTVVYVNSFDFKRKRIPE